MNLTPLLLALAAQTPAPDAGALLKTLRAAQLDARQRAFRKEPVDLPAVEADVKAKAVAALTGLDPAKLPLADSDDWSALYRLAGRIDDADALAEKALNYHAVRAWEQQTTLLSAYIERGDKAKILDALAYAQGTSVPMIGQLGEAVVYGLTGKYGEKDPAFVLQAYDILLRRFDLKRPMAPTSSPGPGSRSPTSARTATPSSTRPAARPRPSRTSSGSRPSSRATGAPRTR